jgi:hypothetical protein
MGLFSKKPADLERDFVGSLNALVRAARKNGVGARTIRGNLSAHVASFDREFSAESERRQYGEPNMKSGNI